MPGPAGTGIPADEMNQGETVAAAFSFAIEEKGADEAIARVDAGLDAFNAAAPSLAGVRPLAVICRAADGEVVGGLVGRTLGECAEVRQLWVAAEYRKRGTGAALMQRFEAAAAGRGVRLVYLDTFSFQAPGFYRKLGYEVALEIAGYAEGVSKFTLVKRLPQETRGG